MALYIPHSISHLVWLLYGRPETFGPTLGSCPVRCVGSSAEEPSLTRSLCRYGPTPTHSYL